MDLRGAQHVFSAQDLVVESKTRAAQFAHPYLHIELIVETRGLSIANIGVVNGHADSLLFEGIEIGTTASQESDSGIFKPSQVDRVVNHAALVGVPVSRSNKERMNPRGLAHSAASESFPRTSS